jgi:hypothetical protein
MRSFERARLPIQLGEFPGFPTLRFLFFCLSRFGCFRATAHSNSSFATQQEAFSPMRHLEFILGEPACGPGEQTHDARESAAEKKARSAERAVTPVTG